MKRFFQSLFDVRRGERGITLLMMSNLYLILVAYYFLKPARDSLFLTKLGPEQLPYVFILTAFLIVPITTLYARASRSFKLNHLITMTTVIVIVSLVGLRLLMSLSYFWIPYVFYIWVSIYGALMTSQMWLLANAVYNSAQAKRIFSLLGLAGILGAWTGGEVTSLAISSFGLATEDLLIFCIGIMVLTVVLTNLTWRLGVTNSSEASGMSKKETRSKESIVQLFMTIKRSKHLLLIVGIISVTMMVASLVDFQFKTITVQAHPERSDLTAFLGLFYGRLSAISFLLQLLLTYRFLRVIGVGGAIMLLPLGLVIGSAAMLAIPGLAAAVLLRGGDGALKYSIDKTGRELLFLPVSIEIKKRTKVFIDMFVDRWARGLAGGLLLLLIPLFGFEADPVGAVQKISIVVLVLLVVWLVMAWRMRQEYVNTFRVALANRTIDPEEVRININDKATVESLLPLLSSGRERQMVYALDLLGGLDDDQLTAAIKPLVKHEREAVRVRAVRHLAELKVILPPDEIQNFIKDDAHAVRVEGLRLLMLSTDREGARKLLAEYIYHPEPPIRTATFSYLIDYASQDQLALIDVSELENCLNETGADCQMIRPELARSLGHVSSELAEKYLPRLLGDDSPEVVRSAILAAGRQQLRSLVPTLVQRLGDPQYRVQAKGALREYGSGILGTLADYLTDESINQMVRQNIPGVLSGIPHELSVVILTRNLAKADPNLKFYMIQGLNRLNRDYPELKLDKELIDEALIAETKVYYQLEQAIYHHNGADRPAGKLLSNSLDQRQELNLERIFRLLGLTYGSDDIYRAYQNLKSKSKKDRASAIEFLDNLLRSSVKKYLIPILDEVSPEYTLNKAQELFGLSINSESDGLVFLLEGRDAWLRACAVYRVGELGEKKLLSLLDQMKNDPDPVVRETVEHVLGHSN